MNRKSKKKIEKELEKHKQLCHSRIDRRYNDKINSILHLKELEIRNRSNANVDDKLSSIFTTSFVLQWSDVKFYHKYFIFTPKIKENIGKNKIAPLRVDDYRCKDFFNYILTYFQERLPKITYRITKNFNIQLDNKPQFEVALADLVKEKARYDAEVDLGRTAGGVQYKLGFSAAMAKAEKMKPEDFKKYKSRFIDFLVEHQSKEHKIVPVSEDFTYANGSRFSEEGFVFTTKSNSDRFLVIVIENINPDRATMYFSVRTEMYEAALRTIFNYIQSDTKNKRSAIRDGKEPFKDVGFSYYGSTPHDYFYDWKNRLNKFIR